MLISIKSYPARVNKILAQIDGRLATETAECPLNQRARFKTSMAGRHELIDVEFFY